MLAAAEKSSSTFFLVFYFNVIYLGTLHTWSFEDDIFIVCVSCYIVVSIHRISHTICTISLYPIVYIVFYWFNDVSR